MFRVSVLEFVFLGSGFWVLDFGCRFWGSGFGVLWFLGFGASGVLRV